MHAVCVCACVYACALCARAGDVRILLRGEDHAVVPVAQRAERIGVLVQAPAAAARRHVAEDVRQLIEFEEVLRGKVSQYAGTHEQQQWQQQPRRQQPTATLRSMEKASAEVAAPSASAAMAA